MAEPYLDLLWPDATNVQIEAYRTTGRFPEVARPVGTLVGGRKVVNLYVDPTWNFDIEAERLTPAEAKTLRSRVGTTLQVTMVDDTVAAGDHPYAETWQLAPFTATLLDARSRPINSDQRSGDRWSLRFQTSESDIDSTLGPPRLLRGRSVTQTEIVLAWIPPATTGGVPLTDYEVRIDGGAEVSVGLVLEHTFAGLVAGSRHTLEVRALNMSGDMSDWASVIVQTSVLPVPSRVRSLSATPGDTEITLRWSAPADVGGGVLRYEYQYEATGVPTTAWISTALQTAVTVTSLTDGVNYRFRVRAVSAGGNGPPEAVTATPATPPGAVRNLVAQALDTAVRLDWDAPANTGGGIDRYEYQWETATDDLDWTTVALNTFVTVGGLTDGVNYRFRVRAVGPGGNGTPAAVTSSPAEEPGTVGNLQAVAGDGEVLLSWDAPANPGGGVTGYEWMHELQGISTPWQTVTGTMVTVEGLSNNETYRFRVRAFGPGGTSPDVAAISATPMSDALQATAPTNLRTSSLTRLFFTVLWDPPLDFGDGTLVRYEARIDGSGWANRVAQENYSPTVNSGVTLQAGQTYTVQVRAVTTEGFGSIASLEVTTLVDEVVPESPRNLVADAGDTIVVLTWDEPVSDGGAEITGYEVSTDAATWVDAENEFSHTVRGLANGTAITFHVRAVNSVGESIAATVMATPMAGALTPPTAPENLEAEAGNAEVVLTWDEPLSPGDGITAYQWQYEQGGSTTQWVSVGLMLTVTVGGLINGTAYRFRVRAVGPGGNGTPAAVTSSPVAPSSAPTAPRNLTAEPGDTEVTLTWDAPTSLGTGTFTRYEYEIDGSGTWISTAAALTVTVTGLTNGTEYDFAVRAVTNAGEGAAASVATSPVAPLDAPGVPRNLMASPGDGEVTLDWDAPSDPGSGIDRYQYMWAAGPDSIDWTSTAFQTQVTVTGLTDGVNYRFRVRAQGPGGSGPAAAITSSPALAPGVPRNLMASPGDGEVTLDWDAPADEGGGVTGYEWQYTEGGSTTAWAAVPAADGTATSLDGLSNGASYRFRVRAVGPGGSGPSAAVTATPVAPSTDTRSTAPQNLRVSAHTVVRITVTWTAPSNLGTGALVRYEARIGSGTWVDRGLMLNASFTGLSGNTSYTIQVRAVTLATDNSDLFGAAASVTQRTNSLSNAPRNLAVSGATTSRLTVTWDPPTNLGSGTLVRYEARRDSGSWVNRGGQENATFTGLSAGTEYTLQARAVTTDGDGASASLDAWTTSVAGAVSNLRITSNTGVALTAQWDAPASLGIGSSDGSAASLTRYEARLGTGAWVDRGAQRNASFTGLSGNTSYTISVRAVTAVGNGATASISETTDHTLPGPVRNLSSRDSGSSLVFEWDPPSDLGSGTLRRYEWRLGRSGSFSRTANTTVSITGGAGVTLTIQVRVVTTVGTGPIASYTS